MHRRLLRRWILWLLPILALRALLPIGFMLSMDGSGVQLAFCPTQAPALAAAFSSSTRSAVEHAHDHHHAGVGDGASHDTADSLEAPCPYALGALALAFAPTRLETTIPRRGAHLAPREAQAFATAGPVRAERIRGPPLYS